MKEKDTALERNKVIPCYMCRQPVTEEYRFTVSWSENGEEHLRILCGARCLKDWVDHYSENIKLELYDI